VRGCSPEEKGGGGAVRKSSDSLDGGGAQERPRRGSQFFFSLRVTALSKKNDLRAGASAVRRARHRPSDNKRPLSSVRGKGGDEMAVKIGRLTWIASLARLGSLI
jgi:hypothetical protein